MTPSELREYEFKGAGRNAYKADDVDIFFGEVAVAYEKLFRENRDFIFKYLMKLSRDYSLAEELTQETFYQAVRSAKKYADDNGVSLITINSWNEWTETSYLQPDDLYGYGYLEAIRDVFTD